MEIIKDGNNFIIEEIKRTTVSLDELERKKKMLEEITEYQKKINNIEIAKIDNVINNIRKINT